MYGYTFLIGLGELYVPLRGSQHRGGFLSIKIFTKCIVRKTKHLLKICHSFRF